jgi:hypothetical protein
MKIAEILNDAVNEYMILDLDRNFEVEIREYDGVTNQLFLWVVGDMTEQDRRDLQEYLRSDVPKLLISVMEDC